MENYKRMGPIATLPQKGDLELLEMRDAEDGDSEMFDDLGKPDECEERRSRTRRINTIEQ